MKNRIWIFLIFLIGLALLPNYRCKKEIKSVPVLKTIPVLESVHFYGITENTALFGVSINSDGGSSITSKGVCWSIRSAPTIADNKTNEGEGTGAFKSHIIGLTSNTIYFFRAYVQNKIGTAYGDELMSTTLSSPETIPVLGEVHFYGITENTASFGVFINSDGGSSVTSKGVCWSIHSTPTIADSKTNEGEDTGSFISHITGLNSNTIYFFRVYAQNKIGTAYGHELMYTTLPSPVTIPVLGNVYFYGITENTALFGVFINSDGGSSVISKGVCWSIHSTPTIADYKTNEGEGTGSFMSHITGLTSNTIYFFRAYAQNNMGTAYGEELMSTTLPSSGTIIITDIDGNQYRNVTIGTQVWMAENLKTTEFSNGDSIRTTSPAALDVSSENIPEYQWAYGGDENNTAIYGRLYSQYVVTDSRNLCPAGWHVPSHSEWEELIVHLGGYDVAGSNLKKTGETDFNALLGGFQYSDGTFMDIGFMGVWWNSSNSAWSMDATSSKVHNDMLTKQFGLSVRCLRN